MVQQECEYPREYSQHTEGSTRKGTKTIPDFLSLP